MPGLISQCVRLSPVLFCDAGFLLELLTEPKDSSDVAVEREDEEEGGERDRSELVVEDPALPEGLVRTSPTWRLTSGTKEGERAERERSELVGEDLAPPRGVVTISPTWRLAFGTNSCASALICLHGFAQAAGALFDCREY